MQAMKCEICGSNDIVKQEGIYVCQHCGTKYTVEEAKKLVGTVKIDRTEESSKYLTLARRAAQDKNYIDASKYYERVLQEYPDNWEATFYQRYYQVFSASPAEVEILGKSFSNSMGTFVRQLKEDDSIEDKKAALTKMRSDCLLLSEHLFELYKESHTELMGAGAGARWIFEKFSEAVSVEYPEYSDVIRQLNDDAETYTNKVQNCTASEMNNRIGNIKQKSGGCYIATCVYGSYDCPQVWTLRRYRDNALAATWYGRTFIRMYYIVSPKLVKAFGETNWFKNIWRHRLDRMVSQLQSKGVADTPYTDK